MKEKILNMEQERINLMRQADLLKKRDNSFDNLMGKYIKDSPSKKQRKQPRENIVGKIRERVSQMEKGKSIEVFESRRAKEKRLNNEQKLAENDENKEGGEEEEDPGEEIAENDGNLFDQEEGFGGDQAFNKPLDDSLDRAKDGKNNKIDFDDTFEREDLEEVKQPPISAQKEIGFNEIDQAEFEEELVKKHTGGSHLKNDEDYVLKEKKQLPMDFMQNKSGVIDEEERDDFEQKMLRDHTKNTKMQRSPREQITKVYTREQPDSGTPQKESLDIEKEIKEKMEKELRILKQKQEREKANNKSKDEENENNDSEGKKSKDEKNKIEEKKSKDKKKSKSKKSKKSKKKKSDSEDKSNSSSRSSSSSNSSSKSSKSSKSSSKKKSKKKSKSKSKNSKKSNSIKYEYEIKLKIGYTNIAPNT